jgi:hypothetical protein
MSALGQERTSARSNLGVTATHLYRWARRRSVRTEHAAIAGFRSKPLATALAVIEKLASIRRHLLRGLVTAFRAGDCRNLDHINAASRLTGARGLLWTKGGYNFASSEWLRQSINCLSFHDNRTGARGVRRFLPLAQLKRILNDHSASIKSTFHE